MPSPVRRKTPEDATEFEREQLQFLLSQSNFNEISAETDLSLAWLPFLYDWKIVTHDSQLIPWLEKNFSQPDAIREVAANIRYFKPEAAEFLEGRLNSTKGLPQLFEKCWRLIIRHIRAEKRGLTGYDWFDIVPRIKRGDHSSEVLERIVQVLRPRLRVGKRLAWGRDGVQREPERPSDLMSIDYEIDRGVTAEDVLATWPKNTPAEIDSRLLHLLTEALSAALEDAIDVGVEDNEAFSTSDSDVPSVAQHEQNAYRTGFLPIVRVVAELWTRLVIKVAALAVSAFQEWQESHLKLVKRIAIFAAADAVVPAESAGNVAISLSPRQLFFTNASVEFFRLFRRRGNDLPSDQWQMIERRLVEGPPPDRFREDAEVDRIIDRSRFDFLGELHRMGMRLSEKAQAVLADVQRRYPQWELKPENQAGFHVWMESSWSSPPANADPLVDVPDNELVAVAKAHSDNVNIVEGDAWGALCKSDLPRALRGLEYEAERNNWPDWAWRPLLWADDRSASSDSAVRIGSLLLRWPPQTFGEISADASWWLSKNVEALDDSLLWPLWDRIYQAERGKLEDE